MKLKHLTQGRVGLQLVEYIYLLIYEQLPIRLYFKITFIYIDEAALRIVYALMCQQYIMNQISVLVMKVHMD